ncbi:MAG: hypothetical protein ACOH2H_21375 [Cypionkella sp.]
MGLGTVRLYRQGRLRGETAKRGIGVVILSDPIYIRYGSGTRNVHIFSRRNLQLTQSRSVLFEFTGCLDLGAGFETVDDVRPANTASLAAAGPHIAKREQDWSGAMGDLIAGLVGWGVTVGLRPKTLC